MDSFSSAIKDQLSYNKKIESQLTQLAITLPFATIRKMDPRPIHFGFWCLMTNTTKLD